MTTPNEGDKIGNHDPDWEMSDCKKCSDYKEKLKILNEILNGINVENPSAVDTMIDAMKQQKKYIQSLKYSNDNLREVLKEIISWGHGDCYCLSDEESSKVDGKICPTCFAKQALREEE